jgi:glucokinase
MEESVEDTAIGVDIGGTKVLAGAVTADGTVLETVRLPTPHRSTSPQVVENTIVAAVRELEFLTGSPACAVGIGAAGFVDARGNVAFSPHLAWRAEPWQAALEGRLRTPVTVDNDANTTAWAELRFGAARSYREVVCLTLGTGIGGALVLNGEIYRGGHGMAGEFGHMQVVPDGRACECGNTGCWEQYSSGNTLVRSARQAVTERSPEAERLRWLVEDDPDRVTGPLVTQAARDGDLAALEAFGEIGDWLGVGLAGLAAAFDPELLVVGGGVADAGSLLLDPAQRALGRTLTGRGFRPEPRIVPASLGTTAGFVGAAALARQRLGE